MFSASDNVARSKSSLAGAVMCGLAGAFVIVFASGCSSSDDNAAANTGVMGAGGQAPTGPQPKLPPTPSDCPNLATGTVQVMGKDVQLWVGDKRTDKKGPILFYWHGTGSVSGEAEILMGPEVQEVVAEGGMVASFTSTLGTGTTTGNLVWYTGDYEMADYLLGCALEQLNVDTQRIYAAGCSAGGLQAGSMALARSSYIASAMPNSGGTILVTQFEDESHVPSVMTAHGACASDHVVLYFADWSKAEDKLITDKGGFAVDCEHSGGHCGTPRELYEAQWQFLKDHPFNVTQDPYADGLPASFPSYCTKYPADPGPRCQ